MSTQLDPTDFADLLDRSFTTEPVAGDPHADLARGRRLVRRRRHVATLGTVGVAAALAAVLLALPVGGTTTAPAPQPSSGSAWTDAEVLDRCTHPDEAADEAGSTGLKANDYSALRRELPDPVLLTRGDSALGTVATIRGANHRWWGDCDIFLRPVGGIHTTLNVYDTSVSFRSEQVGARRLYDPVNEADSTIEGSATSTQPTLFTPCRMTEPEDTQAYFDQMARCDRFTVTWNDRRPADVAAARVRLPDGTVLRADVRGGYLSLGHTGTMTPRIARMIRGQHLVPLDDVTFLDAHGEVLAHGHGFGDRRPGIERFPSLALWMK